MSLNNFPLVQERDPQYTNGPLGTVKIRLLDHPAHGDSALEGIVGRKPSTSTCAPTGRNRSNRRFDRTAAWRNGHR